MTKREDAAIFLIGHKPLDYGYWDDSLYTPIQVGNLDNFTDLRDNTGVNIADWNSVYAEGTATFWISRNFVGADYIGQCQYRRRLPLREDADFNFLFSNNDVIAADPLRMGCSVEYQYSFCHNAEDLAMLESVVKDLYPDYAEAWDKYIKHSNIIYYSNGFIMRGEDYFRYADWLFSIFSEYRKRMNWNSPEDVRAHVQNNIDNHRNPSTRGIGYQMQVFGFQSERLLTLYLQRNFNNILNLQYVKYEGI